MLGRHLALMVFLVGLISACSGSDASMTCDTPLDCEQAFTCVAGVCQQVECTDFADCPGDNETCLLGVDPTQPDKKFCTPVVCNTKKPCPEGYTCNEYYQCIADGSGGGDIAGGSGDIVDEETPGGTKDTGGGEEPGEAGVCQACASDADCDGTSCYPLGGGQFCFASCTTNDECPSGWMCYQLTNDGQQCIPMAFNCDAECLKTGCPAGQVCDQESGQCQDGEQQCGQCNQDWDCALGYKCYTQGKYCAPGCPDGTCPGNSSCKEVNALKVKLCVSSTANCCYGSSCENPCQAPTPYPLPDGKCGECLENGHCAEGKYCEQTSHSCMDDACAPPKPFQKPDGTCVECLNSSHCTSKGTGYACKNYVCVLDDKPPECANCPAAYPACTQINGVWSCVQCTDDTYCTNGTCDLSLFACDEGGGGVGPGCGNCTSDGDCLSSLGKTLACDKDSGCCYDPGGFCDDVESMCDSTALSECLGLMELLMGGMGGIPGMSEGMAGGVCTCDEPMGMEGFICLFMGGCPPGGCLGNTICIDPASIPMLGDMFGAMGDVDGLCINPTSILGML